MTGPDLTDDDYSDLAALVREAIDAEPYRIGPRIKKLRGLLAKLDPSARSIRPKSDPSWAAEIRAERPISEAERERPAATRGVAYKEYRILCVPAPN
jgi:hypothetical protein